MNLDLTGRRCVVVGGGKVAERKVIGLLSAGGRTTLIAPHLTERLLELARAGLVDWYELSYMQGMLKGLEPLLVFCATDSAEVNELAAQEARELGALVNDVTEPESTDFTVPASLRRGDLLVTVSTEGASPGFARAMRRELEQEFPESFGRWLEKLKVMREEMKGRLATSDARQDFWRQVLSPGVLSLVRCGELEQAEAEIRNAITDVGAES
jgi:precorrin-2 dehydrogenase/sirohydrochlorin ferrochelatase